MKIPGDLTANIVKKGIPIMLNEIAWSTGQAFLLQCYSVRGLSVVAALNISSTVSNLFNVVFLSTGGAIAIIVGQLLGAGKMEEAKDTDRKLLFFTVSTCLVCGSLLAAISPFFPLIYNTSVLCRQIYPDCRRLYAPVCFYARLLFYTALRRENLDYCAV